MYESIANISEVPLGQYLAEVLRAEAKASGELVHRENAIRDLLVQSHARERHPLRWALGWIISTWWQRLLPWAVAFGVVTWAVHSFVRR